MSIADLVLVAVVVLPIVLLLSFAGCGIDAVGTADPDIPLPPRKEPEVDKDKVEKPPDIFGPGSTDVPVAQPDANRYHNLVLKGTTELIAYWKLDDTAVNGTAADSGPVPVNPGIYRNGVAAADGVLRLGPWPLDGATRFDGTGFVNVAYDTVMNPASSTNFSLEAWILPTLPVTAGRHVIAGSYRVAAAAGQIDRGFALELIGGAAPIVRARTAPDGNAEAPLTGGVSGWHHVVLAYEAATKRLRLFLNGAEAAVDATASYTANRQTAPTDIATPLRIGAGQVEPFNAASTPALFFSGRIDQVALYRGALTATDVAGHFVAATTL